MALYGARALVFDTFGTVVDWRGGLRARRQAVPGPSRKAGRRSGRLRRCVVQALSAGHGGGAQRAAGRSSGWTFCTGRTSTPWWPSSGSTPRASPRANSMR